MSVSIFQHFGPFIKVKIGKVETPISLRCCSKNSCKNFKNEMKSSFCPICGSPQTQRTKMSVKPKINLFDFEESFDCSLTTAFTANDREFDGCSYLIPNVSRSCPRKMSISPREHDFLVADDSNKELEMEWLNKAFEAEIKKLIELLGPENVTLGWGLISYMN
jgi:hypothetical protein